jgi:hypothetical protein
MRSGKVGKNVGRQGYPFGQVSYTFHIEYSFGGIKKELYFLKESSHVTSLRLWYT